MNELYRPRCSGFQRYVTSMPANWLCPSFERAARVARSDLDVVVLADVLEGLQVGVVDEIVQVVTLEDIGHVALEHFAGRFDERVHGFAIDLLTEMPSSLKPFVAEEVVDHQRLIDPGPHVRVPCVVLTEQRLELARLSR